MKKIIYWLNHLEEYLLTVLMGMMASVVFIQVIARELGASLPWSEELTRYTAVWVTFVGASLGIKRGAHIGVEAFTLKLPEKARTVVGLVAVAVCLFFCYISIRYGVEIISKQMATSQKSPSMRIPMWWAYLAMPVGFGFGAVRCIQVAISQINGARKKRRELPDEQREEKGGTD